jgi:hypothetical protein
MHRLYLGAAIVLSVACADSAKKSAASDSAKPVAAEKVAAVDSAARRNTNFAPSRTPAVVALESFAFDTNRVDSAAMYALSLDELRLLRGLVFGRHGRHFADDAFIQSYLASQPWYKADSTFTNASLNDTERDNLDIIRGAEAVKHDRIMPGDVRFYRGKVVTSAMLGHHTPVEWRLLSSEVLAIHGHEFNDYPDEESIEMGSDSSEALQFYYDNRYWYRRRGALALSALPAEDRELADSIDVARIRDLGTHVGFGMMRLFRATLLTEENLKYATVMDLRLMRNEVYALHGREFTTLWIKRTLAAAGYQPKGGFRESDLSEIEKQNIALIRRVEDRKHEELSTKEVHGQNFIHVPLSFVRLLRNELYARHGKIFKDKALQAYFSSQPWYKPNRAFSESMLTDLERKNTQTLLEHEKLIGSGGKYPEG